MAKDSGLGDSVNGFSHVVLYKTNPNNPKAVDQIKKNAQKYLATIPGIRVFFVAPRCDTGRVVSGYRYDIGMNFVFDSKNVMEKYMVNSNHLRFVKFVLNGWMLEGSDKITPRARKEEFIKYILNSSVQKDWVRDLHVPESEVVWAGERVFDFGC